MKKLSNSLKALRSVQEIMTIVMFAVVYFSITAPTSQAFSGAEFVTSMTAIAKWAGFALGAFVILKDFVAPLINKGSIEESWYSLIIKFSMCMLLMSGGIMSGLSAIIK